MKWLKCYSRSCRRTGNPTDHSEMFSYERIVEAEEEEEVKLASGEIYS